MGLKTTGSRCILALQGKAKPEISGDPALISQVTDNGGAARRPIPPAQRMLGHGKGFSASPGEKRTVYVEDVCIDYVPGG